MNTDAWAFGSGYDAFFHQHQRTEFALVVHQHELVLVLEVLDGGMDARYGDVFGDLHIDVFASPQVYFWLLGEAYEVENLTFCAGLAAHQLQDDVGFGRFGDVDRVELLVVHVDAVLEGSLAHLAG